MPDFAFTPDDQPDKRPHASGLQPGSTDAEPSPTGGQQQRLENREYDRRGVLLPARARVGGIITPQ